jgi:hypothetical protein
VNTMRSNSMHNYSTIRWSKILCKAATKASRKVEIGLLIRNAIYAYLVQYQYMIQEQQQQQQQHNNPSHNQNRTRAIYMAKER